MPQNSAAYAVGRVRVLESRLLDRDRYNRMLEGGPGDILRMLNEMNYGGGDSEDYERLLAKELDDACRLVREVSPQSEVTDAFLIKYDYHNIKVLVKTRTRQEEAEGILLGGGTLPVEQLKRAVWEGDLYGLPAEMAGAINAWNLRLDTFFNPQALDQLMDKALFAYQQSLAEAVNDRFLTDYVDAQQRMIELLAALRIKRQGRGLEVLTQVAHPNRIKAYLPILECAIEGVEHLVTGLSREWGAKIAPSAQLYATTGRAYAYEKSMDDILLAMLRPYRMDPFSVVPVVGYLLAREYETRNIRIIMVGKKNGVSRDALEEKAA